MNRRYYILLGILFVVLAGISFSFNQQRHLDLASRLEAALVEEEREAARKALEAEEGHRSELRAFEEMGEAGLRSATDACFDLIAAAAQEDAGLFNWHWPEEANLLIDEQIRTLIEKIARGHISDISIEIPIFEIRDGISLSQWVSPYRCALRADGSAHAWRTGNAVKL